MDEDVGMVQGQNTARRLETFVNVECSTIKASPMMKYFTPVVHYIVVHLFIYQPPVMGT